MKTFLAFLLFALAGNAFASTHPDLELWNGGQSFARLHFNDATGGNEVTGGWEGPYCSLYFDSFDDNDGAELWMLSIWDPRGSWDQSADFTFPQGFGSDPVLRYDWWSNGGGDIAYPHITVKIASVSLPDLPALAIRSMTAGNFSLSVDSYWTDSTYLTAGSSPDHQEYGYFEYLSAEAAPAAPLSIMMDLGNGRTAAFADLGKIFASQPSWLPPGDLGITELNGYTYGPWPTNPHYDAPLTMPPPPTVGPIMVTGESLWFSGLPPSYSMLTGTVALANQDLTMLTLPELKSLQRIDGWVSGTSQGMVVHQSFGFWTGYHSHGLTGAFAVPSGGYHLINDVYIDDNVPYLTTELAILFTDSAGADHEVWWGNVENLGLPPPTATRFLRHGGPLPAPGQWAHLDVSAQAMGLQGKTVTKVVYVIDRGHVSWAYTGHVSNPLPDWWVNLYFPDAYGVVDPNALAPRGDGLTIWQAFQQNLNPIEYYNGVAPRLTIVSGNNQTGSAGQFAPAPLVVKVTGTSGNPLVNAPVRFTVITGSGMVADSAGNDLSASRVARTDANGQAVVRFNLPGTDGATSQITATALTTGVLFREKTASAGSPPGGPPAEPESSIKNLTSTLNSDGSVDVYWENTSTSGNNVTVSIQKPDDSWNDVTVSPETTTYHFSPAE